MPTEVEQGHRYILNGLVAADTLSYAGLGYVSYLVHPVGSGVGVVAAAYRLYQVSRTDEGFEERRRVLVAAVKDYWEGRTLTTTAFNSVVLSCVAGALYGISSCLVPAVTRPLSATILGGFTTNVIGGNLIAAWTMPFRKENS